MIKIGSSGKYIAEIQGELVNRGYTVPLSGYINRYAFEILRVVLDLPSGTKQIDNEIIDQHLFGQPVKGSSSIAKTWLEKAKEISAYSIYGAGRGEEKSGVFKPSKTWHCNSIAVFMLHWYYNVVPYRKHSNLPPTEQIMKHTGEFIYQNRYKCFGFQDKVRRVSKKLVDGAYVSKLTGTYIIFESTFNGKRWRWGHHVCILMDGIRWAADGWRNENGTYSGTKMFLGPWVVKKNKLYEVYEIVVESQEVGKWENA